MKARGRVGDIVLRALSSVCAMRVRYCTPPFLTKFVL